MTALKFEGSIKYSDRYTRVATEIRTEKYREIASTFSASISRVGAMAQLPSQLNYWSTVIGICTGAAMERLGEFEKNSESLESQKLSMEFFQDWTKRRQLHDQMQVENDTWFVGSSNIQSLADQDQTNILREGLQATLSTMISSAWATFETLGIDLWVASVDLYPQPLAVRALEKSPDKSINFQFLNRHGFDLSQTMGSVLFESGKIGFQKFDNIKGAYALIFANDWKKLFDTMPALLIAENVRHLFAHRTGFVDQTFINRTRNITSLRHAVLGQQLELTGDFVATCVDACVITGVELLQFVDEWSQQR